MQVKADAMEPEFVVGTRGRRPYRAPIGSEEVWMRAADVMTSEVITVAPTASVQTVANLLGNKGISAVPVVDSAAEGIPGVRRVEDHMRPIPARPRLPTM
jgi:predicted transcriptional regulator